MKNLKDRSDFETPKPKKKIKNKFLKIACLVTIGAIGFGIGAHFYNKHMLLNTQIVHQNQTKKVNQKFETAKKVLDYLYSIPVNESKTTEEYVEEYMQIKKMVEKKFSLKLPNYSTMSADFKMVNNILYSLACSKEQPNVYIIKTDPRYIILDYLLGKSIDETFEFFNYVLENGNPNYGKNNIINADIIFSLKKGVCMEKSVMLATYLVSLGVGCEVIFVPPVVGSVGERTGEGHAFVKITTGESKGCILDPGMRLKSSNIVEHLVTLSKQENFPPFIYAPDKIVVVLSRFYSEEELPVLVTYLIESGSDEEYCGIIKNFKDSLRLEADKEKESMEANLDNLYYLIDKYGIITLNVQFNSQGL
ncbi:hypothetical protein KO465_08695 [Candidatus Micrarchaeota archaeon]|nr:hypothetical protein [Candidatus Micrarchaeota archaeon]